MKIIFLENRHKTFFWKKIAQNLSNKHEIHWLIQNKNFFPSNENRIHFIKYPKNNISYNIKNDVEEIIKIDRQINHFQKKDRSYFYYYDEKINDLLLKIEPDIVFGESTAFHELLTINNCKKLNIKYLNPSSSRYPKGRFAFYENDTLKPFEGSKEEMSEYEINQLISEIIEHKTLPDYMKLKKTSLFERLNDKILKIHSYYSGEIFNTPNPIIKLAKERTKKKLLKLWDKLSKQFDLIDVNNNLIILYPLQFQPESNIDVWGKKYRDQVKLIKSISDIIPKNSLLLVKPNPKSHYEVDNKLIELINSRKNIIAINKSTNMESILKITNLVITVTGTIAIESIIKNIPVVTLVNTINNKAENCIFIESISKNLPYIIEKIQKNNFPQINHKQKMDFISKLNMISYKGLIGDPFLDKKCISDDNIEDMTVAFNKILKTI